VVDCRTDGCAGRDEKDVGVRSCNCGVAVWLRRKVLLEWLTGTADRIHAKSGTLFFRNGALPELRSYRNGTIYGRNCPATD